ncbi:MAG: hypothetical protein QNJ64_20600 [Crocosphaera sp.]|nr:hypothetical protein [Crocosphaera sp.]
MNKIIKSLAALTGTMTALWMSTNSAVAAVFNWSYTTGGNNVYSGMLEGNIQEDTNTVDVTSVFMSQLNGSNLPATPVIRDSSSLLGSTGVVSFDGTTMDLGACLDTSCLSGIFIGNFGISIPIQFTTSSDFGNDSENFNAANWQLTEKTIPEPSLTLALVGLGLSALLKTSVKKN